MERSGNAVWAHELRLLRRRWVRWFGMRWAEWCAVGFACCYVTLLAASTMMVGEWHLDGVAMTLLVGLCILAPGLAAVSLASERQRGSWTLLTTTPLTPLELLGGKFLGRVLCLGGLCALAVPLGLLLETGQRWQTTLAQLGAAAAYLVPVTLGLTGLGLLCSARSRTVTGALLWSYGLTLALLVGVPLLGENRSWLDHRWAYATCPFISVNAPHLEAWRALPSAAFYLLLALVGFLLPLINFEHWLRLEGEPRRSAPRVWALGLTRAVRQARREWRRLLLVSAALLVAAWARPGWLGLEVLALPLVAGLLAWQLALVVPEVPERVATRLSLRLGLGWPALVLGRWAAAMVVPLVVLLPGGPRAVAPVAICAALAVLLSGRRAGWQRLAGVGLGLPALAWSAREWVFTFGNQRATGELGGRPFHALQLGLLGRNLGEVQFATGVVDRVPLWFVVASVAGLALLVAMVPPSVREGDGQA